MPLNIRVGNASYYSGAVLEAVPSVDSVVAAIPGFLGAFDAADWSGSGTWLPRLGSGASILPAATGTIPVKTTRDGLDVVRFAVGSKAFVNDLAGAPLTFSAMTYASRAYFSNNTTNFQKVFDLGAPEFFFRSTLGTPVWQFAALGATGTASIATPVLGWHRFTFSKSGTDAALLEADAQAAAAISGAGTAMSGNALTIGDTANTTSAAQDIRRIIICNAGVLTADQRTAINTWLSL